MVLWKNRGLDTFSLKVLAVVFMLLDHIYLYFFSPSVGAPLILTCVGRLAFPLFLFCMVWGYHYTRSRKRYLLRLYLGSLFMTGFSLVIARCLPTEGLGYGYHNIFMSMFWVGLLISTIETFLKDRRKGALMLAAIFALQILYPYTERILRLFFPFLPGLSGNTISGIIPNLYFNEYGFEFVAMGVLMYFLKEKKDWFCVMYLIFCIAQFSFEITWGELGIPTQWLMAAALPFMMSYNNEKGYGMKYFFYIFYPAHTFLLFYIANFVLGKA